MKNRRRHPRLDTDQPAVLHYRNHTFSGCQIHNFSVGGVYLKCRDSRLNELLQDGYYAESERQQAVLELASERLKAEVAIVYLHGQGIGVCFVDEAQSKELVSYLNSMVQDPPKDPSTAFDPALAHTLMQQMEKMLLDHLRPKLTEFFTESRQALLSSMREPTDNAQESALFFAMTLLEGEEQQISDEFIRLMKRSFHRLLSRETDQPSSDAQQPDELELMEKTEIDRWVVVNDVARQSESELAPSLHTLEVALSYLLQNTVASDRNPLSPQSLLNAMSRVLSGYELNIITFNLILKAFQRTLLADLKSFYEKIQHAFSEQGLKLALISPTPGLKMLPERQGDKPVQVQALPHLSNLFGLKFPRPTDTSPEKRDPLATQHVIESLESLPLRLGSSLLKQLEHLLVEQQDKERLLDPAIRAAIGTGEELVAALQQDPLLPDELKGLLERLEVPIIQAIIKDPALLENSDHPVRHLLKACEGLIPYLGQGKTQMPAKGKSGIAQLLDAVDQGTLAGVDQVTEALEKLQRDRSERFRDNRQLAVSRCEKDECRLLAEQRVRHYLDQELRGKSVSIVLDRLFQFGWTNLLVQTHILQGEKSPAWKAYLRVIEILLKLFQRGVSPLEMTKERIHDLISIIRKGFRDHPVHPQASKRFVIELKQALSQGDQALASFHEQRVSVDDDYLARYCPWDYPAPREEEESPPTSALLETVNAHKVGEWVVVETAGKAWKMFNLAWKNAASNRYLWVDGSGFKALDVSEDRLDEEFGALGERIVPDGAQSIVDRAIDRILLNSYNEIKDESAIDDLTGLMNRRCFERHLRELLAGNDSDSIDHTLILLDLDQFQVVNDLCGFEGGDILLQTVASILLSYQSEEGVVARIADDEFALLIPDTNLETGFQIAESQRRAIEEYRYTWDERLIPVSASLGVVQINRPLEMNTDALLQAAVSACRLAKEAGRNCTRIYTASDSAYQHHKQMIQTIPAIQEALKNDRMVLFSQPIAALKEQPGLHAHYEILLRIMDDEGELQTPQTFIKIAEQYDLMRAVDRWVVTRFFTILEDYAERLYDSAGFSVNLSAKSIADEDFREFLRQQIAASPIPPQQLGFEITETALARDITETAAFMNEIRSMGCSCYLDDFGSGYASFSYLKDLPVNYVKIDGIFVREMMHKPEDMAMVISITELAHFMEKQVIAEFVADEATGRALQDMGVDYAQGYHFGRPKPFTDQLDEIISSHQQIQHG